MLFFISPAAVIVLEGVRSVIREGGGSARFNIRLLSGELGIPVDLVYSTYNINATGTAQLIVSNGI